MQSFFEFDEEIYRGNSKINNKQNQVYIINNFDSQKVDYYITEINNINFDFDTIEYISKKGMGLSGTPIFNYNNYKVIGIQKWIQDKNDINLGTLIKEPIKNFFNKYKNNNKNNNNNNNLLEKNVNENSVNIKYFTKEKFTLINSNDCIFNYSIRGKAEKRLLKELEETLYQEGYKIYGFIDNKIIGTLEGPLRTIYENGYFHFEIIYSNNYPFRPPIFFFKTIMFHPNIKEDGNVFIDILKERWTPELSLKTIIISIQSLLNDPNTDNYTNKEAADLYRLNRKEYEKAVRLYISKFANYSNINIYWSLFK